ncbi:hypothetical protein NEISUBOT_03886 [Neisseria subflava NJ9703]|uniref:Uncharacterized protein n=1 Tax=Neisseria subflava NJ9703 TaxID=546268 RepID=A0A9W5IRL3_NEISU|nr:hypothetical protein NEISUBOT_03886 [Neisseria subflava NJ9703]
MDCFGRDKIKERVSIGITLFYFSDGLIGDKHPYITNKHSTTT